MIKKVIVVYFVLVFLIVGTYFVDSVFLGNITPFTEDREEIDENQEGNLVTGQVIAVQEEEVNEEGNIITGNVIQINNEEVPNEEENLEDGESSTSKKLKVSVEVVG